jgi:hypothetical protein
MQIRLDIPVFTEFQDSDSRKHLGNQSASFFRNLKSQTQFVRSYRNPSECPVSEHQLESFGRRHVNH